MIKKTNLVFKGCSVSYEVLANGYGIYFDNQLSIVQIEPNIPYPDLPYEVNAVLQIKTICGESYELEEEIKKAQPLSPWEQTQLDTALNLEYLICLQEGKV